MYRVDWVSRTLQLSYPREGGILGRCHAVPRRLVLVDRDSILPALKLVLLTGITLVIFLHGCYPEPRTPVINQNPRAFGGILNGQPIEHVVIFAIDGLKEETLFDYLKFGKSFDGGLHDLLGVKNEDGTLKFTRAVAVRTGITVFPSYTYPAWTSIFTGVFPGAHGITGNMLFFKDKGEARYYTERDTDALRVQFDARFLSGDISNTVKTVYEVVDQAGGQSIVVHHMITRGATKGHGNRSPQFATLVNYVADASLNFDRNAIWEAVKSLQEYNRGREESGFQLPTLMTIYFAGLDHEEHIADDETKALTYLKEIDALMKQFIDGAAEIGRYPFHPKGPVDVITGWKGLKHYEEVFRKTLFVVVSDHGHTRIEWRRAVGIKEIKEAVDQLRRRSGNTSYELYMPRPAGTHKVSGDLVTVLNGGSLGIYVRNAGRGWEESPNFEKDILPVLERLLPILDGVSRKPEFVFYRSGNEYMDFQYEIRKGLLVNTKSVKLNDSPLVNSPQLYPDAYRRLLGLVDFPQTLLQRRSGPDIVLLADRKNRLTFANSQDPEFRAGKDIPTDHQLTSDHGPLGAEDSLVPIIFAFGGRGNTTQPSETLKSICEASVVDVAPTILDLLGVYKEPLSQGKSYEQLLAGIYPRYMGHSLKDVVQSILRNQTGENICSSRVSVLTLEAAENHKFVDLPSSNFEKSFMNFLREQQASLISNPDLVQRGHLIERVVTFIWVENKLYSLDRFKGMRAKGVKNGGQLLMQFGAEKDPPQVKIFDYRSGEPSHFRSERGNRLSLYYTDTADNFDLIGATTWSAQTQCPGGRGEDFLAVMNRAAYPNGITIRFVYDNKPKLSELYSVAKDTFSVTMLMEKGALIDKEELETLRRDIARFQRKGALAGLDRQKVQYGQSFDLPHRYWLPEGRQFVIRHSCSYVSD